MNRQTRRSFLSLLASLPIVGSLFAKAATEPAAAQDVWYMSRVGDPQDWLFRDDGKGGTLFKAIQYHPDDYYIPFKARHQFTCRIVEVAVLPIGAERARNADLCNVGDTVSVEFFPLGGGKFEPVVVGRCSEHREFPPC